MVEQPYSGSSSEIMDYKFCACFMRIKTIVVAAFVLLGSFAITAQVRTGESPASRQERENELAREKAFQLRILDVLHSIAKEAYGWDDVKVSAKTQAQAADLLWGSDPISAENYLTRAWTTAKKAKEAEEKASKFRNSSNRVEASREVLLVARKRNPELAKKWLKELSDLADEDFKKNNNGDFDDRSARSAVLLQVALQVVDTDPQTAAALLIESFQDGISFGMQIVLVKIQEKNPELAAHVFRAAVQRINSSGIKEASEIQILFSYLYTPGQTFSTRSSTLQGSSSLSVLANRPMLTPAAQLYPALAQEFLVSAANAILRLPFLTDGENPEQSARDQYGIIPSLLSKLGNSSPQLSQSLQERLASVIPNANFGPEPPQAPGGRPPLRQGEDITEYRERILDVILEEAEKIANPLQRDIFIAQRVLRSEAEQHEKAISIADHIDDKELRQQILNFLIYRASLHLINRDRLAEAYKLAQKDEEPRHRASILIVGGQKFSEKKNFIDARNWLNEAHKLFEKNRQSHEDWINIGFGLVWAYAQFDKIDASRQLDSTVKLIDKLNKSYSRENAPLGLNFSGLTFSDFTSNTKHFSLNSAVDAFGKEEFDSLLASIETIPNGQAKGEATLFLCRKHIKPTTKPLIAAIR